jgi:hypothetical protein
VSAAAAISLILFHSNPANSPKKSCVKKFPLLISMLAKGIGGVKRPARG